MFEIRDFSYQEKKDREPLSPSEVMDILVDPQEANIQILDTGYEVTLPEEFPFYIDDGLSTFVKKGLGSIIIYLKKNLITDDFGGDNDSRRTWEKKQEYKIKVFLGDNRLAGGSLAEAGVGIDYTSNALSFLADSENMNPDTKKKIEELIAKSEPLMNRIAKTKNETKQVTLTLGELAEKNGLTFDEFKEREAEHMAEDDNENTQVTITVNDPDEGYDILSLDEKLKLVEDIEDLCIELAQVFGITASKDELNQ